MFFFKTEISMSLDEFGMKLPVSQTVKKTLQMPIMLDKWADNIQQIPKHRSFF